MIAFIRGNLISKTPQYVVVDVNGVGYMLHIPLSLYPGLPPLHKEVTFHTYTYVREDVLQLYGFTTPEERDFFATLLTISGVGPRMGLNILSGSSLQEIKRMVDKGDVKQLSSIPGVGKKTAARIILELKEKLAMDVEAEEGMDQSFMADAVSALVNLGYPKARAIDAINRAIKKCKKSSIEDIIREALKILSST